MTYTYPQIAEALLNSTFTFAKTMPQIPHFYTLRKDWQQAIPFEDVVQFIRDHGYVQKFGKTPYTYLEVNGLRYWTMGAPLSETILINRAKSPANRSGDYDALADTYDQLYDKPEFEAENLTVFDRIPEEVPSLLDIGCGTGLTLDYVSPLERYVGIDPSQFMLDRLTSKFRFSPSVDVDLFRTGFEGFHLPERYSFVVCLFGVSGYMPAEQVRRIPDYVEPGGTYVVTVFAPGYEPVSHRDSATDKPVHTPFHYHPASILPGDVTDTGNGHLMIVGQVPAVRKRRRTA